MAEEIQERYELTVTATQRQFTTLTDLLYQQGKIDLSKAFSKAVEDKTGKPIDLVAAVDLSVLLRHSMDRTGQAMRYEAERRRKG